MAKLNDKQVTNLVASSAIGEAAANHIGNFVRKIAKLAPKETDTGVYANPESPTDEEVTAYKDSLTAFNSYFQKVKEAASIHIKDVLDNKSLVKRMFVQALASFDNYDVEEATTGKDLEKAVFEAELDLLLGVTVNEFCFVTEQMFNEDLRIKGIDFP